MTAVACNTLTGQLALSFSQPVLKSAFYSDMYTVQEEIDTNSKNCSHTNDNVAKHKTASLHRGNVRFAQGASTDLSASIGLSNSKDSGIGSSEDNNCHVENTITQNDENGEKVEEDEELVKFSETAKQFTEVDVQKLSWNQRRDRMDSCIDWLKDEISKMRKQDQTLMRQFMELRSTIHQLKRNGAQGSLRAAYLRNQQSCANIGSDQSAQGNLRNIQSHSRSSLHPLAASQSSYGNLSALQYNSRNNLSDAPSTSHTNLGNFKVSGSLLHLEDTNFDLDTYFADIDPENDSFFDEEDAETFTDQPIAMDGGKLSALSEEPYMPQYRTRTVSLVTPNYIGRPSVAGYLARSRYMSFSNAKGRVESERAILE